MRVEPKIVCPVPERGKQKRAQMKRTNESHEKTENSPGQIQDEHRYMILNQPGKSFVRSNLSIREFQAGEISISCALLFLTVFRPHPVRLGPLLRNKNLTLEFP